jgi:hypothetical protein
MREIRSNNQFGMALGGSRASHVPVYAWGLNPYMAQTKISVKYRDR